MTELLAVPTVVASVAAIVPLLGAVYKAYLPSPVRIRNAQDMAKAIDSIMTTTTPQLLTKGSHDVTPPSSRYNFTIEVTGHNDEEAIGFLQVKPPHNTSLINITSHKDGSTTRHATNGITVLDHNNVQIICEDVPDESSALYDMHGVIFHRFKGKPAFPKGK